jgi:hypothetical protein
MRKVQDADRIYTMHIQKRLLPIRAIHHATHSFSSGDSSAMQLDPRLTRERLRVGQT